MYVLTPLPVTAGLPVCLARAFTTRIYLWEGLQRLTACPGSIPMPPIYARVEVTIICHFYFEHLAVALALQFKVLSILLLHLHFSSKCRCTPLRAFDKRMHVHKSQNSVRACRSAHNQKAAVENHVFVF